MNFMTGKSNSRARAAALAVAESPGKTYNPLLISAPTGLGKTHLVHAIRNELQRRNPQPCVIYLSAEQWMCQYVTGVRDGNWDYSEMYYRSIDALLIDDIQFFASKERARNEFFHTLNWLIDSGTQIVLTCGLRPTDMDEIDNHLKLRFARGMSAAMGIPDLKMRIRILQSNSTQRHGLKFPNDVTRFIAQRVRYNVRDLEGALNRLSAFARLRGEPMTVESARNTLKDMLVD